MAGQCYFSIDMPLSRPTGQALYCFSIFWITFVNCQTTTKFCCYSIPSFTRIGSSLVRLTAYLTESGNHPLLLCSMIETLPTAHTKFSLKMLEYYMAVQPLTLLVLNTQLKLLLPIVPAIVNRYLVGDDLS